MLPNSFAKCDSIHPWQTFAIFKLLHLCFDSRSAAIKLCNFQVKLCFISIPSEKKLYERSNYFTNGSISLRAVKLLYKRILMEMEL